MMFRLLLKQEEGKEPLQSDLNLRLDLSMRDNKTISTEAVEDVNQPVAGQKIFSHQDYCRLCSERQV